MAQATRSPSFAVGEADLIWSELGELGAEEMLDHMRSDNRALDALRVALERDIQSERAAASEALACK